MATLMFFDEGHRYEVDGVRVPSVSEILAPLNDFDGELQNSMEIAIENAAERGTVLHYALCQLLGGEDMADAEIPGAYGGYYDAVLRFIGEHDIKPYLLETPLYSPIQGYAGTPDAVCQYDGADAVLDFKFVAAVNKPRVKAQLNAYKHLCEANGIYPERLVAVQFLGDGNYRAYETAVDDTEFELCRQIYQCRNKKHPRGRIE